MVFLTLPLVMKGLVSRNQVSLPHSFWDVALSAPSEVHLFVCIVWLMLCYCLRLCFVVSAGYIFCFKKLISVVGLVVCRELDSPSFELWILLLLSLDNVARLLSPSRDLLLCARVLELQLLCMLWHSVGIFRIFWLVIRHSQSLLYLFVRIVVCRIWSGSSRFRAIRFVFFACP
jgi:hypothetical protein